MLSYIFIFFFVYNKSNTLSFSTKLYNRPCFFVFACKIVKFSGRFSRNSASYLIQYNFLNPIILNASSFPFLVFTGLVFRKDFIILVLR